MLESEVKSITIEKENALQEIKKINELNKILKDNLILLKKLFL
jgi:hypothetical protein